MKNASTSSKFETAVTPTWNIINTKHPAAAGSKCFNAKAESLFGVCPLFSSLLQKPMFLAAVIVAEVALNF
jgi:hypothetical protein